MVTEKTVVIDEKEVKFKATARTPRLYRTMFGRDMFQDMRKLKESFAGREEGEKDLSVIDLTLFENVAYTMAKHADPGIEDTPDEWLETFTMFSIYQVLPEILQLWNASNGTLSNPKKK